MGMLTKNGGLGPQRRDGAQAEEGYSIEAQQEKLIAYCRAKEIAPWELFVDGGFSGSNLERPALQRLLEEARAGRVSHVLVYKLDRLSRSQKDTLYLIEDVFRPNGVEFISINESMDTATPMGRLMVGILSAFAQLERENIRERTRMGMRERVRQGYWMGGGKVPFGYDYNAETGTLVPNADADTVREMYRLYRAGYSADKIAGLLGFRYPRQVYQILRRESNVGQISYNGQTYPGRHRPLVSREEFDEVQRLLAERSRRPADSSPHLLTGLVVCGKCGAGMRYQKWGKDGHRLVCYSRDGSKPYLVRDPHCDNPRPRAEEVEAAVLRDLFALSLRAEAPEGGTAEKSAWELLTERHKTETGRLRRLYRLYADGDDTLLGLIEEQKRELAALEERMAREQTEAAESRARAQRWEQARGLGREWEGLALPEKKAVLRALVEKVVVTGDRVDIYYTL